MRIPIRWWLVIIGVVFLGLLIFKPTYVALLYAFAMPLTCIGVLIFLAFKLKL